MHEQAFEHENIKTKHFVQKLSSFHTKTNQPTHPPTQPASQPTNQPTDPPTQPVAELGRNLETASAPRRLGLHGSVVAWAEKRWPGLKAVKRGLGNLKLMQEGALERSFWVLRGAKPRRFCFVCKKQKLLEPSSFFWATLRAPKAEVAN